MYSCEKCESGKFQDQNGASFCVSCSPGKFSVERAEKCTDCSPGTYAGRNQREMCDRCIAGSFSDAPKSSICKKCPNEQTTLESGATSASECGCPADEYAAVSG